MARKDKVEIWLIEDADVCQNHDGNAVHTYQFVSKGWEPKASTVKRKNAVEATLEELVELCDQDAEGINAHDFCGTHRLLGAVLFRRVGRGTATIIMRDIAERRGLHGMGGMCGTPDSYKELGVGEGGRGWSGKYK